MNAGTYGHKILDIYYKLKASGVNFQEAAAQAFQYNPDADTCECGCHIDSHKLIQILNLCECHRCKKCINFKPKHFELSAENRAAVLNRLRDYFYTYQTNDFEPLSPEHVEVGFSEPIYEDNENLFVLEGRIDLIAKLQGLNVIADHKFQMRMHNLYSKSIQFKNYALVNKSLMFVINYIRLSKGVTKDTTLTRELVSFTVPELLEWKKRLIAIFFRIKEAYLRAPALEQNWSACSGKYNYACKYTPLCEEFNPEMAKIKEQQLYDINKVEWRPW